VLDFFDEQLQSVFFDQKDLSEFHGILGDRVAKKWMTQLMLRRLPAILHPPLLELFNATVAKLMELSADLKPKSDYAKQAFEMAACSTMVYWHGPVAIYWLLQKKRPLTEVVYGRSAWSIVRKTRLENDPSNPPLAIAAFMGDLTLVQKVIETLGTASSNGSLGWNPYFGSPLLAAISTDHLDVVQHLIDIGADVNKVNRENSTPLHIAIEHGNIEAVSFLVEKRASLYTRNIQGYDSLALAIYHNNLPIVRLLIKLGRQIHRDAHYGYLDREGWMAMSMAIKLGRVEIVKFLLNPDVGIIMKRSDRLTLQSAAPGNNAALMLSLLENAQRAVREELTIAN
jgi:hypothetical protein